MAKFAAMAFAMLGVAAAASPQSVRDAHVLSVIHKRLLNRAETEYHGPFIFVGKITRFGPIYQGVCKSGVGEEVDFSIAKLIWGDFDGNLVRTSYINCATVPLPSPPFALHAKSIVYCENLPSGVQCLNPLPYSEATLREIEARTPGAHSTY